MVDIIHRIGITAPAGNVYDAIASVDGVAGWWTRETSGTSQVGESFSVIFRDGEVEKGRMEMEVVELNRASGVRWRVMDGPAEWIGTDVTFELTQEGDCTVVLFGHRNWREAVEFTAHCSMKWATFLLSLRALVESGQGRPAPDDLKIDNWN
jgi:uncharacterized protein YndB with AHSA1/START domain